MDDENRKLIELMFAQHLNQVMSNMMHNFSLVMTQLMFDVAKMTPEQLRAEAERITATLSKPKE